MDQNNSKYGYFSRAVEVTIFFILQKFVIDDCLFELILRSSTMLITFATAFLQTLIPCLLLHATNSCAWENQNVLIL